MSEKQTAAEKAAIRSIAFRSIGIEAAAISAALSGNKAQRADVRAMFVADLRAVTDGALRHNPEQARAIMVAFFGLNQSQAEKFGSVFFYADKNGTVKPFDGTSRALLKLKDLGNLEGVLGGALRQQLNDRQGRSTDRDEDFPKSQQIAPKLAKLAEQCAKEGHTKLQAKMHEKLAELASVLAVAYQRVHGTSLPLFNDVTAAAAAAAAADDKVVKVHEITRAAVPA